MVSGGNSLGTAVLELTTDNSKLERGLDQSEGRARQWAGALGKLAAGGALAVTGIGVAATKMAADFQSSMAEVRTLLPDITDEAFGAMEQDVLDFSKQMGIATGEAVPALYQAISAGVPQGNVMEFMEVASKAAIGGVTDLETAVDGITSVVNAYGSEVIDAQRASDVMFTAVKLGKTDFEQLSRSLFNVVPTASSLGISFEEVTAALATMTAQGVPTSVATTQLRQAFVEAAKGGTDLDKAIRQVAGKGFAELTAEGATAYSIFQKLRVSMPEQEFKDLFGSVEAMNAALQITGPNVDAMSSAFKEAEGSAGAVDAAFATVSETASHQFGVAMNQLKVMMIEFGSLILPHVAAFVTDTLVPAFERFSAWFEQNRPEIERAIDAIIAIADDLWSSFKTGFDAVFPILKSFAKFLYDNKPLLVAAIGAVGLAIVVALGPVSGAVLAIAGIVTAIGFMRDNWDTISEAVKGFVSSMAEAIKGRLDDITGFFSDLPGRIARGLGSLASKMTQPFRDAFDGIRGIINAFIRKWNGLDIQVPSVDVPLVGTLGGFSVGTPNLPEFGLGGVVPGPIGAPVPILAHGGETVLPTHRSDFGGELVIHNVTMLDGRVIDERWERLNERELTRGNRFAGGRA